jgi:hypothetical protein
VPLREGHNAALQEGRRRWVERMRFAKARGLIEKFPCGRKRRGQARPSADRTITRGRRVVEAMMRVRTKLPAPPSEAPAKPWDALTAGEKLARNSELALDVCKQILSLAVDPGDTKLLREIKDTALSLIATRARLEEAGARWGSRAAEESERARVLGALAADLRHKA